jgi:uncharacterized repeat protein (TIGR03803 family)
VTHESLLRLRIAKCLAVLAIAIAPPARAQTYEVLHTFTGADPDGAQPLGTLLAVGNELYGTTYAGGSTGDLCAGGCGTVYKIDASGGVTTVHAFDSSTEGILPSSGLILGSDGKFYGTTFLGGNGDGAIYSMTSDGTVETVLSFDRDTGGWYGGNAPTEGTDGFLYVVTVLGHCDDDTNDCPQILKVTLAGDSTPLHTFTPAEGWTPLSPLLQASDFDFYGTTSLGGGGNPGVCGTGCGTVYHMNGGGGTNALHAFVNTDGAAPAGALLQATDGNFYGVTDAGGTFNVGTVYRIDSGGGFLSLHSFDGTDGANPQSGLIQASDGLLYGTTEGGGQFGFGTLYRMDLAGNVVKLHDFDGTSNDRPDGLGQSTASLTEGSDGKLYGARHTGGDSGFGFVFRYTPPPPAPLYCPNNFVRRDQMAVFLLKTEHGAGHTPPACTGVFPDVACPGLFADWVEELASEGITAGCGGGDYCPISPVTREQMAVFLLKAEHGSSHTPPVCTGVFADVPCPSPFAPWIEELASEGVTGGCGAGNYCPASPVTRAQMAVFLLKIEHGGAYVPPACTPLFADVVCPSLFADWIEQLFAEGITAGCS